MAEYIEREAVMQELGKFFSPVNTVEQALMLNHALKVINWFPAADVAPVVHGRWIEEIEFDYNCSPCGCHLRCSICNEIEYDNATPDCPNCGAKMRGDAE
jgi:hypothetical protein